MTLILLPSITAVVLALLGICAGFFTIHAAAVGSLNRKLSGGQGRANALYVLFYYMGGWLGITLSGFAFKQGGWSAVICICLFFLVIPLSAGIGERKNRHRRTCPGQLEIARTSQPFPQDSSSIPFPWPLYHHHA